MKIILFIIVFLGYTQKIAFGSCFNKNDLDTQIFTKISEHQPKYFIWLGDAAYVTIPQRFSPIPDQNEERVRATFDITKNHAGYLNLRETTKIEGVWDDHDYNERDGIFSNPTKDMIRQIYLDFLDVPKNDLRRDQEGGIYYSFMANQKVKVILLDVRWNRNPNTEDVLGDKQWLWLSNELTNLKLQYVIGSGSQILPDDRLFIDVWYEKSRGKLISLLEGKNAILMSGDVHFAEILQDPCSGLLEITSSGISYGHHYRTFLRGLFEFFAEIFQPDSYSTQRFATKNYGIIDLDKQVLQLFDETHMLLQFNFDKQPELRCEDLAQPIIFRYFWNFYAKMLKFTTMRLFQQLTVIAILGFSSLIILVFIIRSFERNPKSKEL